MAACAGERRLVLASGAVCAVSFSADIGAFAAKAKTSLDETVRAVTFELFTGIITSTPVDTGRARGNWQTTTETPASGELDRTGSMESLAEVASSSGGAGSITYLTNNLPYIIPLEEGHSDQAAPGAMVRGNFERVTSIVENAARRNRV